MLAPRSPNHHYRCNGIGLPSSTSTVRDIDPRDRAWVQREARRAGISMEEFVRRIVREKRATAERPAKPSDAFRHCFGPEHGVELVLPGHHGYRPVVFGDEREA